MDHVYAQGGCRIRSYGLKSCPVEVIGNDQYGYKDTRTTLGVRDCIMSMIEDLSRGPTVLHLALMNQSGESIVFSGSCEDLLCVSAGIKILPLLVLSPVS
jgi:hypothetical protein